MERILGNKLDPDQFKKIQQWIQLKQKERTSKDLKAKAQKHQAELEEKQHQTWEEVITKSEKVAFKHKKDKRKIYVVHQVKHNQQIKPVSNEVKDFLNQHLNWVKRTELNKLI